MKQTILLLILMLFAGFAFAQTAAPQAQTAPTPPAAPAPISEEKPLANVLSWLIGQWEGEGVMSGDQEFVGNMKGSKELDDQAIVLLRESMNRAGGIAGG